MTIVIIVVVSCVLLLLTMYKQANENNVRKHLVKASGKKETLRLFFISDTHARKINKRMINNMDGKMDAVVVHQIHHHYFPTQNKQVLVALINGYYVLIFVVKYAYRQSLPQ